MAQKITYKGEWEDINRKQILFNRLIEEVRKKVEYKEKFCLNCGEKINMEDLSVVIAAYPERVPDVIALCNMGKNQDYNGEVNLTKVGMYKTCALMAECEFKGVDIKKIFADDADVVLLKAFVDSALALFGKRARFISTITLIK